MAISAAFQAELDRLVAYTTAAAAIKAELAAAQAAQANPVVDTGPAVDADDVAALKAALDSAGA